MDHLRKKNDIPQEDDATETLRSGSQEACRARIHEDHWHAEGNKDPKREKQLQRVRVV